jgi:hypothetical protein
MSSAHLTLPAGRLPPTTESLLDDQARPYFLWWTDATVGQLKEHLASSDPEERAYWMGALLREANTRDVWLFVTPDEIRALWPSLIRYLGRSRQMWAWLLELPSPEWPPQTDLHPRVPNPVISSTSIPSTRLGFPPEQDLAKGWLSPSKRAKV